MQVGPQKQSRPRLAWNLGTQIHVLPLHYARQFGGFLSVVAFSQADITARLTNRRGRLVNILQEQADLLGLVTEPRPRR